MDAAGSTLLILGAGLFQVDLIRTAVDLGARVITLDNVPDNVGHALSHDRVACSTVDVNGVLEAARRLGVDGVASAASDAAIPALAVVRSELGLPGAFSPAVADAMSNKAVFRRLQQRAGLPVPRFTAGFEPDELVKTASPLGWPLMVKPALSSGSRGITRVDTPDALRVAATRAASVSRDAGVVVETFIHGTEFGGDAFLEAGEIVDLVVTDKFLAGHAVAGHFVPEGLRPDLTEPIRQALVRICAELGYGDGPLNFDVMVGSEETFVLEVSARSGGNGIPCIALRARGVDFHDLSIRQALGLRLERRASHEVHSAGAVVLAASRAGQVHRLPDLAAARSRFENLWDIRWCASLGDRVEQRTDSDSMLGLALFDCAGREDYEDCGRSLQRWVDDEILNQPAEPRERKP